MMMSKKKINSLYIHIPFCKNICPYCDFVKFVKNQNIEDKYVDQLINDLQKIKQKFKTVYIGGGTPSILNSQNLEKLLKEVNKHLKKYNEFTIECNPEDINESFLKLIKKYNVNRISIGIQTFNKEILKSINRDYNLDYFSIINLVKKYIKNINVDFIFGFKNQTLENLRDDLNNFIKFDVNHISIYSLIVDEGSLFYIQKYKEQDEDQAREFYDFILSFLRKNSYKRYEVSNFAKNKKFSKHNLSYWNFDYYLAIGVGASGFIDAGRYTINKSINKYLKGIRDFDFERLNKQKEIKDYLLCNLRKEDGFKISKFNKIFKINLLKEFGKQINYLLSSNLIKINHGFISCTDEGIILLDRVLIKLYENL